MFLFAHNFIKYKYPCTNIHPKQALRKVNTESSIGALPVITTFNLPPRIALNLEKRGELSIRVCQFCLCFKFSILVANAFLNKYPRIPDLFTVASCICMYILFSSLGTEGKNVGCKI
eukprot:NODE_219_length_12440_cov_2.445588.p12 type:complete len:117 gc:universal NODE_219_length_12440_cov_2.445588:3443-3093(-)